MAQTNSRRVSHDVERRTNPWRGDDLQQIIDDITESTHGPFYEEIEYIVNTPFVSKVVTYFDSSKTLKRSEAVFTYVGAAPPFVDNIVTSVYKDNDDSVVIATITETFVYNSNKTVQSVDIDTVRL